jgi:hypothetical protein
MTRVKLSPAALQHLRSLVGTTWRTRLQEIERALLDQGDTAAEPTSLDQDDLHIVFTRTEEECFIWDVLPLDPFLHSAKRQRALQHLLRDLFERAELERWVVRRWTREIWDQTPGPSASTEAVYFGLTDALSVRNLVDEELFAELLAQARRASSTAAGLVVKVAEVARLWSIDLDVNLEPPAPAPPAHPPSYTLHRGRLEGAIIRLDPDGDVWCWIPC